MKTLTFVDAAVLIYAANRPTSQTISRRFRALKLLTDPAREFAASEFLKLEVMPIPTYFKRGRELRFYEAFFASVSIWADSTKLLADANAIACKHGIAAMDALHLAAAQQVGAEFVSAERPTKPIYRAYRNISSIY
jgi:predicted nucleic acid-binding protein